MIPFNIPPRLGTEVGYIEDAIKRAKLSGDGEYTKRCNAWFENRFGVRKALLTTSCTHALEMCALLLDVGPGDEVILPSYTFVSTSNAFAIRGATLKFIDVDPSTMNIDDRLIEQAVTSRTKVIVAVHYAGVSCDMDAIMAIAKRHGIKVVEDAAQGVGSKYKGRYLGTIGDLGAYSFHETKNVSCGEGGLLLINDPEYVERAEIIREKGTNRSQFFRGQIDKYTWVDIGSSYLPSELNAAYLYAQLEGFETIQRARMDAWERYRTGLSSLRDKGVLELPVVPADREHNAHMFYVKAGSLEERTALIDFLKERGIMAVFHYVPLHSAPGAKGRSSMVGSDKYTTRESDRLLRLPLYYGIKGEEVDAVCRTISEFYDQRRR